MKKLFKNRDFHRCLGTVAQIAGIMVILVGARKYFVKKFNEYGIEAN